MVRDRYQGLVDMEEIKQLKARYYRFNDTQDWQAFRSVFTEDVCYDSGTQVLHGADRVASTFAAGLAGGKTAHIAGLPEITLTGPDTATGIWAFRDYVQVAGGAAAPVGFHGYGHEHDEYVRTADGWKIKRVVITRVRIDPLEGGLPEIFHQPHVAGDPIRPLQ
jgi:hypothetical protein